jgi:hypothetical protein
MLLSEFQRYEVLVGLLTLAITIFLFASLLTSKTPALVILLSIVNMFFSSYMSLSSYNVVQAATLADGTIVYNTLTTMAFDPFFYSQIFQMVYWYSVISFILGIAFSLVVIYDNKQQKKHRIPKWKQDFNRQHGLE